MGLPDPILGQQGEGAVMKHRTLRDRYAAGLQAMGYVEIEPLSRYRCFSKPTSSVGVVLLGANGAVRVNSVRRAIGSRPLSKGGKLKLLDRAAKQDE